MHSLFDHEIIEELHSSPRSRVYRARAADATTLIVKIPNQEFLTFQQVAQFKREYEIARRCRHAGIVRPIALEIHRGRWTMLQEDIEGCSLHEVLRARHGHAQATLRLADFFEIAMQLCAALEAVHRHGVIHKDLNPSNIIWNSERQLLQLIDFGIACELPHESHCLANPDTLEGTLRYMAPEQTGRMNRRVDYRADFYALGATFYELLTGQPPFDARDEMELVHCHIARSPNWSHPALSDLPGQLLAIVQRLMEKNADRRYQSALGVQCDIAACRGPVPASLTLRLSDYDARFIVPQTLRGREDEVGSLLDAFARSTTGACEMVLVAGYSGIGKSAVVHEIQREIVARRGCFLAGKFDQFQSDAPFASLIQACLALVRQLLGEPEDVLRQWDAKLREALGSGLSVMVELIPQLALIVGPTDPASSVTPDQAEIRMNHVFAGFVSVFATVDHPLVLFLDDLQWIDPATLKIIARLVSPEKTRSLLLIGAYRDNEVPATHPLARLRDQIVGSGARLSTLTLKSLTESQVALIVSDTVRVPAPHCAALARLCFQKTGGNPFFLNQFLGLLYDAGHLRYRPQDDCWVWDLPAINQVGYTDNVVVLLLEKIRRLPESTQHLLQLAASIGNDFTLDMLALVVERAPGHTQQDLWHALDSGLIQPLDERYKYVGVEADADVGDTGVGYRFLHDQVQHAAYLAVDAEARTASHLRIGRLLLLQTAPAQQDDRLFDIVRQLNLGRTLIDRVAERVQLAVLNLRAGVKARRSAAFHAALQHMQIGLALLPQNPIADMGDDYRGLWFDLQLGVAEAAYLCGHFHVADSIYPLVRAHSATPQLLVACIAVQAHQYQLQGRLIDAIAVQREGLAALGVDVPHNGTELTAHFNVIFAEIGVLLNGCPPDTLLAVGEINDPNVVAVMRMMQGLWMASYYAGQQELSALMVVSMTRLSIKQGTSDFSAVAYVAYAMILALYSGDVARGYSIGAMALTLARSRANLQTRTLTGLMFAALTNHWTQPLRSSDALYAEAFGWALEIADFVQVGVVAAVRATDRIILSDYLPDLMHATLQDLALMRANGQHAMADCCVAAAIQPMKCLMGLSEGGDSYDDVHFSEVGFLERYGDSRLYRAYYLQGKIRNAYLFDGADAEALASQYEIVTQIMRGQAKVVEVTFYAALILLRALRRELARIDSTALLDRITAMQISLAGWASSGSDSSNAKSLLVQAEMARYRNDLQLATHLYQETIDAAGLTGYINIQALANELCGECWFDQKQPRVATVFFQDAIARYGQWGADGKVKQLRVRYGGLLTRIEAQIVHTPPNYFPVEGKTSSDRGSHIKGGRTLDMVSLVKAAQILSNESGLRNVLARLITIVRENAGGQVARLLLLHNGEFRLEADIQDDVITVLQSRQLDLDAVSDPQFPLTLLRYAIRTGAEVIEDCITEASRFASDPYVQQHRPRAVMCLPIRIRGRMDGVLYFENRLAEASFTEERVAFLRMLGAQAMISIASARLNDSLELRVAERTAQLEQANRKLATLSTTDSLTGLANRRHFDDVLRAECAHAKGVRQPCAVIMLDVDYFKRFNDRYGHQEGDICLARVARTLADGMLRPGDLAARYGGEEFSVVLPNTSATVACQIGEALRRAVVDLRIEHAAADMGQVTISVGIAIHTPSGDPEPDTLMRMADAALYQAKAAGRNCVVLSDHHDYRN